jgi:hypothetical protein
MTNVNMGEGSMVYTAIYQEPNGDVEWEVVCGHQDRAAAWTQGQKYFKRRLIALVPGNHYVTTQKSIS